MGTELVAVKDEMHSLARVQAFRDVLAPYRLPVEAWRTGLLTVFETTNILRYCDLPSVMNSAMTIAVLGLRMDKATGQSCIVPFKGKAQPIIMVQGYTVVAGRGGYTLQSRLVREGEAFREIGGSNPAIVHEPIPGNTGKPVGTYAVARSLHHPVLFTPFMSIDEIMAVRDRSKGYQSAKDNNNPHPWMTDFEAMMLKTPKRRLAKDIPNDQLASAAWLDTQHDLGNHAFLNPDGHGVTEAPSGPTYPDRQPGVTDVEDLTEPARPRAALIWNLPTGAPFKADSVQKWTEAVCSAASRQQDTGKLQAALDRNREVLNAIMVEHPDHARTVMKAFNDRGIYFTTEQAAA